MKNIESILSNSEYKSSLPIKLLSNLSSFFPPKEKLKEKYGEGSLLYYMHKATNYTIGFLTKANVGVLPSGVLEKMCTDLSIKHGIEEIPQKYTKYSVIGLSFNILITAASSIGLINVPEISIFPNLNNISHVAGYVFMTRAIYSTLETGIRAYLLFVKNRACGIFPLEIPYYLANKAKKNREKSQNKNI
jgi:hypothetical protein